MKTKKYWEAKLSEDEGEIGAGNPHFFKEIAEKLAKRVKELEAENDQLKEDIKNLERSNGDLIDELEVE